MLNFTTYGDGPGTPTLIVHGLFGSARNWGVIAKRLSDRAKVVTVDQRNHGNSPWKDSHTYPDMAADLAEVIDQFGERMDVIGHSMGGKAAMALALTHPDSVGKLVLGDIAPVSYGHTQMPFIDAMRAVDLDAVSRRSDAQAQLAAQGVDPALQSFFTQSLDVSDKRWRLNLDALADQMPQILSFPHFDTTFDRPALFLSGADSDYVTADHRPAIKALFPAARFARLSGAGHWLHADKPREFEASVRAFLDR